MNRMIVRLILNVAGLYLAVKLVPGFVFEGQWWALVVIAVIFGLVNALIRPVLLGLSCLLNILTLGLFTFVINALLIGVFVFRPDVTATQGGKILAFLGLFLLPLICVGMGITYHIDHSKQTQFCLSCHEMEPYGKSLLVDDPGHLTAAHFQNHRVPAEEACYTCHTNYAMFGGFRAKMHGLKHVYVHYLGTPPAPESASRPIRQCLVPENHSITARNLGD